MVSSKIISRNKLARINFSFLPAAIQVQLAFDPSKHPKDEKGRFAKKGTGGLKTGQQNRRGKKRFEIKSNETEHQAFQRALSEARQKRLKRQGEKTLSRTKFNEGLRDYQKAAKRQEYEEIMQATAAGEKHPRVEESEKSIVGEVARDAGITIAVHKTASILGNIFRRKKKGLKIPSNQQISENLVNAGINAGKSRISAAKLRVAKNEPLRKAAKETFQKLGGKTATHAEKKLISQAIKSNYHNHLKSIAGAGSQAAAEKAAISTGTKLVGASRFSKLTSVFGKAGGAAVSVGGFFLQPQIAIPLTVGAAIYGIHRHYKNKAKREQELMQHERELMRQEASGGDEDREFNKELRAQTAREVARQASIYAARKYAKEQVEHQKSAIDESVKSKLFQRKMKRSARITAYAAAKEYSKKEREQAYKTRSTDKLLYFSHTRLKKKL